MAPNHLIAEISWLCAENPHFHCEDQARSGQSNYRLREEGRRRQTDGRGGGGGVGEGGWGGGGVGGGRGSRKRRGGCERQ